MSLSVSPFDTFMTQDWNKFPPVQAGLMNMEASDSPETSVTMCHTMQKGGSCFSPVTYVSSSSTLKTEAISSSETHASSALYVVHSAGISILNIWCIYLPLCSKRCQMRLEALKRKTVMWMQTWVCGSVLHWQEIRFCSSATISDFKPRVSRASGLLL
jgi:hypothetical protein